MSSLCAAATSGSLIRNGDGGEEGAVEGNAQKTAKQLANLLVFRAPTLYVNAKGFDTLLFNN